MLKNVVLPAPFGPIRLTIVPRGIVKSTSFTAVSPPNSLRTWTAWSSGSALMPSPSSVLRSLRARSVEDGLLAALLELELASRARDQALGAEQHHHDEQDPEDQELVLRDVDLRRDPEGVDQVVHSRADLVEAFQVQVLE